MQNLKGFYIFKLKLSYILALYLLCPRTFSPNKPGVEKLKCCSILWHFPGRMTPVGFIRESH